MTQINLLPWREQKRERDKKQFTTVLFLSAAAASFIVFMINSYATSLVNNQTERNNKLKNEISLMNSQLIEIKNLKRTRQMLISRMSIVQHLQSTRTLMVHLFDELINVTPLGIYLTQVERKNNSISITGYTESNTFVSILMRNIENNKWLHDPHLSEIKKEEKKQVPENEFKLTFRLDPPPISGVLR